MGSSRSRRSGNIVFVRVGRLDFYDPRLDADAHPVGGGSFNVQQRGSEIENFRPYRGYLYGYAQGSGGASFNLGRISADVGESNELRGVLVVMVALAGSGRGQVVVGWYRNAVVYNDVRTRPFGDNWIYNFRSRAEDAVLLPLDRRTWEVPKGRGAFGQANMFYLRDAQGEPRPAPWADDIVRRITEYNGPNLLNSDSETPPAKNPEAEDEVEVEADEDSRSASGQGRSMSAEDRALVEMRAMKLATKHFEGLGYIVTDVSRAKSYDLLCTRRGKPDLRVEVKGTTGAGNTIILTANEVVSAKSHPTALVVVSRIEFTTRGRGRAATGGSLECFLPWKPTDDELRALQYEYVVPGRPR